MSRSTSRKALIALGALCILGALAVFWRTAVPRTDLASEHSTPTPPPDTPAATPTPTSAAPTPAPAAPASSAAPAAPTTTPTRPPARLLALDPGAGISPATPAVADRWPEAHTLLRDEFPSPADASLRHRVRIVRADFKYPLLRIEELWHTDAATGTRRLVAQTAMVADHLVTKPAPGVEDAAFRAAIAAAGGSVRARKPASGLYLVSFPADAIDALPAALADLRAIPGLLRVAEPDYIVHASLTPADPSYAQLWGLHNTGQTGGVADADIDAPEAWEIATGSRSIRVGVIDTGIDYNHPDLAANIWTNPGEIAGNGIDDDANGYIDDIHGWDFANDDADPMDDHFHGTHCAGTIGGVGGNALGVVGVNWQVTLVAIKFLGLYGGTTSDAVESVSYATLLGLDLTSNSWGGGGYSEALREAIAEAGAAGQLFIAAAGNSAQNTDLAVNYPSGYDLDNIVSVAATDHADQLASFSNYGSVSVDLGAPGVAIYSTDLGSGYQSLSGTSMATPHVAGAAALVLAHRGPLSPAELKEALLENVDPIPALADKTVTGGRLNVAAALGTPDALAITSASSTTLSGTPGGPFTPATITYRLRNTGSAPLPWTATEDADWLDLAPASGTLAVGAETTVSATPSAAALLLQPSHLAGLVTFANLDSGKTRARSIYLVINPFSELVFAETFDSGALDPAFWTTSGDGPWQTLVTTLDQPHGGTHHLAMDTADFGTYARNEATLTLDVSGRSGLRISFAARLGPWERADAPPSNPYDDTANFDGLALSVDGVIWHELQPLRPPHLGESWKQFTVDLDAFLNARTLPYGPTLHLRFNQYGYYSAPAGGLSIDDVRVERIYDHGLRLLLPEFIAENATAGTATLTAHPAPGSALTVTLASSLPASLGVPATITLQPGQSSATFTLTPHDDALRNGGRPVNITASATDWRPDAATLQLADDEAATLALSAPATLLEGASGLATLSVSPAPQTDVTVLLAHSLPDELGTPASVLIPAGQSSVTFPITAIDDTVIDGDLAGTLSASVAGWTTGQAPLTTLDNESLALVLTAPDDLHEGALGRSATIELSGTLPAPLTVTLASENTSVLDAPAAVLIPAGRTSAQFPLTFPDNTDADGARTAELAASAPGFTATSLTLAVADDDAHHFTLDPITGPQIRNAPFAVTLTARDADGAPLPHYDGTPTLAAASGAGDPVAISPTDAPAFTLGVWSGPLAIGDFATGVVLTVTDPAGPTVSSNAFDVGTGTVDHFEWDALPDPHPLDTPIPVTLRAVDAGGNLVATHSGPVDIGFRQADTAEILSWIPYAYPGEYLNTKEAIARFFTRFHETSTTASTPAELEAALAGKHILLVPAQALAPTDALAPIATALAPVLQAFAARGGTIICCSWLDDEHLLLSRSGLLAAIPTEGPTFATLTRTTRTPLNEGVATPFYAYFIHTYSAPAGAVTSLHLAPTGDAVVLSRQAGPGRAILIGTDYFVTDTEMDRVIANAVSTSVATPDSPVLPLRSTPAAFVDGVWSGSVSLPFSGVGHQLVATDAAGTSGASSPFTTIPPSAPAVPPGSSLGLTLPASVAEGSDTLSGTLSVATTPAGPLPVSLSAHPPAKLSLPATVTVPAGQNSVSFNFSAPDDSFLDGDRTVVVTAAASGHAATRRDLLITDDDIGDLAITAPAAIGETGGSILGSVSVGAPVFSPLTITLSSSHPAAATVDTTVTIPAGSTAASFPITPVADGVLDGPQTTTLTASVPGWTSATHSLEVTDANTRTLAFDKTASVYEGAAIAATLTLGGTLPADLVVTLVSSDPAQLTAPATVTIRAGQTSVAFSITATDDTALNGGRDLTLSASAPDYPAITRTVGIVDNEIHHFAFAPIGSPRATHVPISVTLSARNIDDVILADYSGPVEGVALEAAGANGSVGIAPATTGRFTSGIWRGKITPADADTAVRLTASLGAATGQSNPFDVTLSPALTVTPERLDVSLKIDATTTRTLTIANTGGGQLVWRLPSGATTASAVGLADAPAPALAPPLADIPLETILSNLNADADSIRDLIPSRYAFTEGVTGTYIADGGNMYDYGNYLRPNSSYEPLSYSDNTIVAAPSSLGAGGRYFTRKFDGLFVFAADIADLSGFEIDGNLGYGSVFDAPSRRVDTAILTETRGEITYKGFVKRVHGGTTPSVNHLVIVADNGTVAHSAPGYAYSDDHRVTGLAGATRLYYLLYAGAAGAYIDDTATRAIFSAFLEAVGSPPFLSGSPALGRLDAGAEQSLTVTIDATGLPPGVHERNLTLVSNDPLRPRVQVPVELTVEDRVLHHFEFDPLPASLVRGAPATIRLRAVDADGFRVYNFNSPVTLTATGTTLAEPITATDWEGGIWTGSITPATFAATATLSADDGAGTTGVSDTFAVTTGPLAQLLWDPVASPRTVDAPFPVTVRAADAGGNLLDASAPITLSALIPQPLPPTGSHQTNDYFPFRGSAAVVRQQIHYPASALGAAPRRLTGVALNITSPAPGASFAQWTIRLKATPRTTFADPSFDNSGWATVHSSTAIPSTTGWITFPFDAPFTYDGTGSLLVELSFRNPSTGSSSAYISAAYESYYGRALRASSTTSVDPLTLTTGTYLSYVPVLRFLDQHSIPLRAPAAALVNGVWSGSVSLAAPAEFASLLASSANPAATGESNGFVVSAAPELAPDLPFTETWESDLVSPRWTLTGTLGYRTQITTEHGPHGGTRHLVLDSTPYAYDYSRNEATLTLDLAGRTGVVLSFWAKRFYYEYADAPASDPFTEGADFDGVAISADGLTWHEIQPLRDPDLGTDWKQFTVDLDPALATRGLAYTSTFRIRFNRYGDYTAASGGIALDDISVTTAPVPAPTLTLPASVAESAAPFSGTLSLSAARPTSTTFTLASSAPAKLALPASLTLPAGRSSVSFTATPIDDSLFDGTRLIAVTATPPAGTGLHPGVTTLTLADDDSPALTLSVAPSSLPENNYGTATATLRLGAPPAAPITVALASGDPTAATVPASLAFAPGQTTATFPVTVVNDTLIDGTQTTTLSATLPGATPATATFTVTDDETATLALSSFTSVFEGADLEGLITLGGTLPADLVVTLVSSDPARLTVPATVTIPAGDTIASFILDAPDDTATNGGASVTVTGSAPDLSSATRSISVIDDDLHHFVFGDIPSPQATRVPLTVTITAFNIDGIQLTNHTGSVTLSAAGANGPVDLTPATASPFVRGIWSGSLTFTQADTAVRITAAAPTASGLSNAFEVSFSPAIAITPERLDLALHVGSSDTRTLTLANTGGGTLAWSLRVAADVAPTAGQAASDVAPTAGRGIAQESDHGSGLQEGPNALSAAPPPMLLENVLASLNRDHALIRDAIPDRYAFSEGVTGNYIYDGGGNMYDYGNVLSTNLAPYSYSSLPYSNDAIRAATDLLGAGGRYFTRKFDGLFVFAADIDGLSHFEITGGLGAYGAGYTDTATLTRTHSGVTYKGFVKRVFGTTTPSVNHLVIVADNDSVSHTAATNTNSDQHRVSGLSGTTRIYYLLYAGTSGAYIDDTATQAIFSAFLDVVGTPDFLSPSATSGQITAGATEPLTLSFDAADLAPGLHQRNLVFTSNDPARPTVTIPVALTVQDRVLHHFEFDPLPASLVRGAPASIRLRAVDADGFRVYNFNAPVTLSATGTTLAEPVTATGWVGGIWTGQITPATFAAAATLSASDGSGITGLSNAFAVTTGPLAQLLWDPVASPRTVDTPFPVTVRAADAGGNLLNNVSAPLALSALVPQPLPPTGSQDTTSYYPFYNQAAVVRQQIIYPASTLGAAPRLLSGLAMNIIATNPAASFAQWTIRLKNTTRTTFAGTAFDNSGWTTVHSSTATPFTTGWITFPFDAPFAYDGTGSLLVELSFRNPSQTTTWVAISASRDWSYARSRRTYSTTPLDPLTLTNGNDSDQVPVLQFLDRQLIPLRAPAASLSNGVWSGSVSLSAPAAFASLRATSAIPAATGDSRPFTVSAAPIPPPAFPFTETWESSLLSPRWTLTGTSSYRTQITTDHGPHGDTRHLVLDTLPGAYTYVRNEATLAIDLAGRTGVTLSFWAKRFNYEYAHAPASNPFTGGADFDGVAISADGVTWHEVHPLRAPDLTTDWKQFTVDLDAALAARGLAHTSTFRIRFNRYDYYAAPDGGIALDDITVTAAPVVAPTLTLPASATESAAPLSGTLSLPASRPADTVFTLASSAPAKLALPPTLTLPAGQTSVAFTATPIDDTLFDGSRLIAVTATPPAGSGLHPGLTTLTLADDDSPALTLSIAPSSVSEGSTYSPATATLTLGATPVAPLTFALASSDPTAATVPASLAFAPGQTTATFPVTPVNDLKIDGAQTTTLSATLGGATPATATLTVTDNENTNLSLGLPYSTTEGSSSSGSVSISGTLPTPLVVTLSSANPAQLTVPASVTIPAGTTSATFALIAVDDTDTDGAASVTITASAAGFTSYSTYAYAHDNDLHHFTIAGIASAQIANRPFSITAYARTIDNQAIYGFSNTVPLSAQTTASALPVTPATLAFANGTASAEVAVGAMATDVTLSLDDGAGHTGTSNTFATGAGAHTGFRVSTLAPVQLAGAPATVTLTAIDAYGNTVTTYTGSASLSAGPAPSIVGNGTISTSFPANAYYYSVQRTQVVYTPAEIGAAGTLSALALDFTSTPSTSLKYWTIRLKHVASPANTSWQSGWTTVHKSTPSFASPGSGWIEFPFTTPFAYDGVSHLMVDFSYNNDTYNYQDAGTVRGTSRPTDRSIYYSTDPGYYDDPLLWSGTTPYPYTSPLTPNLRLVRAGAFVPVTPLATPDFVAGIWTGTVTFNAPSAAPVTLQVRHGSRFGQSTPITIEPNPAADTDADGLPDAWETTHGLAPGSSSGDDGALGDPDADGLANLLEYATGLDPHARDASPLSLALAPHPTTGDRHLVVSYRRLVAPGSLAIGLTVSENLRDWAAPAPAPDQLSVVPHPDGLTETVTVRLNPALSPAPRFVRLEVTAPSP